MQDLFEQIMAFLPVITEEICLLVETQHSPGALLP
jgi:hypothetical protein